MRPMPYSNDSSFDRWSGAFGHVEARPRNLKVGARDRDLGVAERRVNIASPNTEDPHNR